MALRYHRGVPLIRCAKCGQAYEVPGVIAVRLPNSIATCECGEWISGSKAALLARLMNPDDIKEIDLSPYKVDRAAEAPTPSPAAAPETTPRRRSVRVIARAANGSVNTVFTLGAHPLWIGRKGCHLELAEADLSIRHCSISLKGGDLMVRDADSHMGTFLDGQQITEAPIGEGTHLLRIGSALVSVEPTEDPGAEVEPIHLDDEPTIGEAELAHKITQRTAAQDAAPSGRPVLICIDGPLNGQEFEIPPTGLVVGREGHVRVPDEFLSRRHFEVGPDPDGTVRVRDLGSRNGTFLNTLPARNTKVHGGDEIRAGINRFRIEHR